MELAEFLKSHESRLQKVEETSQDTAIQVAEIRSEQKHTNSMLTEIAGDIKKNGPRLDALEQVDQGRRRFRRKLNKVAVGLLVAGAGAISTKLGTMAIDWVTRVKP